MSKDKLSCQRVVNNKYILLQYDQEYMNMEYLIFSGEINYFVNILNKYTCTCLKVYN